MKTLMLAGFLLVGCATAHRINRISTGMSKADVIATLGNPVSVSADGTVEYLNYRFAETSEEAFYAVKRPYFVRIRDGKVDAYGRTGDFDSTKTPEMNVNIK